MGRNKTRRLVYLTLLSAMAITINILESTYIPALPYGIRFGLANIIALITVELFGVKEMLIVNMMRVVIGNLLRGLIFGSTFWISLSGVLLSSLVLILSKKLLKLPILSMSMLSALGHSTGQVMMVMLMYNQSGMMLVIPYLLISAIPTGLLTGFTAQGALRLLKKNVRF
ncbi:MAG: Gx transporter family protein [Erysipelotrichaceae bacterium]|nr:Gx transporter family protein [Erysipelotrichaceae bacterium]MBQ4342647.1 Gx transporter family protein [Erysipelotrichaceae bacterium]